MKFQHEPSQQHFFENKTGSRRIDTLLPKTVWNLNIFIGRIGSCFFRGIQEKKKTGLAYWKMHKTLTRLKRKRSWDKVESQTQSRSDRSADVNCKNKTKDRHNVIMLMMTLIVLLCTHLPTCILTCYTFSWRIHTYAHVLKFFMKSESFLPSFLSFFSFRTKITSRWLPFLRIKLLDVLTHFVQYFNVL